MAVKASDLWKLSLPFPPDMIEFRVGSTTKDGAKGQAVPYVKRDAVTLRLDEVCGAGSWKNEFRQVVAGNDNKIVGTISVISILVDQEDGRDPVWISKEDGASDTNVEGFKGGMSDSIKRTARVWGIARYLSSFPVQWVELDNKRFKKDPQIPAGASSLSVVVPEGAELPKGISFLSDDKGMKKAGSVASSSSASTPASAPAASKPVPAKANEVASPSESKPAARVEQAPAPTSATAAIAAQPRQAEGEEEIPADMPHGLTSAQKAGVMALLRKLKSDAKLAPQILGYLTSEAGRARVGPDGENYVRKKVKEVAGEDVKEVAV